MSCIRKCGCETELTSCELADNVNDEYSHLDEGAGGH